MKREKKERPHDESFDLKVVKLLEFVVVIESVSIRLSGLHLLDSNGFIAESSLVDDAETTLTEFLLDDEGVGVDDVEIREGEIGGEVKEIDGTGRNVSAVNECFALVDG